MLPSGAPVSIKKSLPAVSYASYDAANVVYPVAVYLGALRVKRQRFLLRLGQLGTKGEIDKPAYRVGALLPVAGERHKQPILQVELFQQKAQIYRPRQYCNLVGKIGL